MILLTAAFAPRPSTGVRDDSLLEEMDGLVALAAVTTGHLVQLVTQGVSFTSASGHAVLRRRQYLPEAWRAFMPGQDAVQGLVRVQDRQAAEVPAVFVEAIWSTGSYLEGVQLAPQSPNGWRYLLLSVRRDAALSGRLLDQLADAAVDVFGRLGAVRWGLDSNAPWRFGPNGVYSPPTACNNWLVSATANARTPYGVTPINVRALDLGLVRQGGEGLAAASRTGDTASGMPGGSSGQIVTDVLVFDKAKWHLDGDWPIGTPDSQASVHIGLFLAWLASQGLVNPLAFRAGDLVALRSRKITGAQLLAHHDGVLASDMLGPEGVAFATSYYRTGDPPNYFQDYARVLGSGLPTVYKVPDTWQCFERLSPLLDERLANWRSSRG